MNEFENVANRHDQAMSNNQDRAEQLASRVARVKETLDGVIEPELRRCEDEIRGTGKVVVGLWAERGRGKNHGVGLTLQINRLRNKQDPDLLKFTATENGDIRITHLVSFQSRERTIAASEANSRTAREEAIAFFDAVLKEEEGSTS